MYKTSELKNVSKTRAFRLGTCENFKKNACGARLVYSDPVYSEFSDPSDFPGARACKTQMNVFAPLACGEAGSWSSLSDIFGVIELKLMKDLNSIFL